MQCCVFLQCFQSEEPCIQLEVVELAEDWFFLPCNVIENVDCDGKTVQIVPLKTYIHCSDNISQSFAQVGVCVLFVLLFDIDFTYKVDFGFALAHDRLVQLKNFFEPSWYWFSLNKHLSISTFSFMFVKLFWILDLVCVDDKALPHWLLLGCRIQPDIHAWARSILILKMYDGVVSIIVHDVEQFLFTVCWQFWIVGDAFIRLFAEHSLPCDNNCDCCSISTSLHLAWLSLSGDNHCDCCFSVHSSLCLRVYSSFC